MLYDEMDNFAIFLAAQKKSSTILISKLSYFS